MKRREGERVTMPVSLIYRTRTPTGNGTLCLATYTAVSLFPRAVGFFAIGTQWDRQIYLKTLITPL